MNHPIIVVGTVVMLLLSASLVPRHLAEPETKTINKIEVADIVPSMKPVEVPTPLPTVEPVPEPIKAPEPVPDPPTQVVGGTCVDWLAQAGIPIGYGVMELINGESGCNPHSLNPYSGACGIPQNINGCSTYDPVEQLRWMDNYIKGRYGSWANAYNVWLSRSPHWY